MTEPFSLGAERIDRLKVLLGESNQTDMFLKMADAVVRETALVIRSSRGLSSNSAKRDTLNELEKKVSELAKELNLYAVDSFEKENNNAVVAKDFELARAFATCGNVRHKLQWTCLPGGVERLQHDLEVFALMCRKVNEQFTSGGPGENKVMPGIQNRFDRQIVTSYNHSFHLYPFMTKPSTKGVKGAQNPLVKAMDIFYGSIRESVGAKAPPNHFCPGKNTSGRLGSAVYQFLQYFPESQWPDLMASVDFHPSQIK